MKLSLLKKESSPAAIIVAASIACLGLAQQVEAGVTWLASDDGINLTLTTTGSLATGSLTATGATGLPGLDYAVYDGLSVDVYNFNGEIYSHYTPSAPIGSTSGNDPWVTAGLAGLSDGHSFGFANESFQWDYAFGANPGTFTPISTMTFPGLTVATAFGTNLDAGPVLLWTLTGTGDTISVAKVPEPSSTALLGLGGLALMLRRRR